MFYRSIQKWYGTYTSGSGTCHRDKTEFVFFFLLIDLIIFFLSRSASVESTLTKKTFHIFWFFLNFHFTCVFRCKPFRMHRYGWFCLVCGFYCPGRRPNLKEITVINHQGALDRYYFQFRTIPGHVNIDLWYLFSLRKRLICHYR